MKYILHIFKKVRNKMILTRRIFVTYFGQARLTRRNRREMQQRRVSREVFRRATLSRDFARFCISPSRHARNCGAV